MPRSTDSELDRQAKPPSGLDLATPNRPSSRQKVFYHSPGVLEQSQHWGGLVIWTIAVGTTAGLLWAILGRVDQTVLASGTLQPVSGKVTVNSPSGGIVRQLFVKDGDLVSQGQSLMVVESEGTKARLQATQKQLALYRYENALFNKLLDQSGIFELNELPEPPDIIRSEDRTRSVQLTVQETASRLRQLQIRLASQTKTLALKQELVNSLRPVYESGGIAKFNFLNSVDELQRLESQMAETSQQSTTTAGQAARQSAPIPVRF